MEETVRVSHMDEIGGGHGSMHILVVFTWRWKARMWLAQALYGLAGLIAPARVEIEYRNEGTEE